MKRFFVFGFVVFVLASCNFSLPQTISIKTNALYTLDIFKKEMSLKSTEESVKNAFKGKSGNTPSVYDYNPPVNGSDAQHYLVVQDVGKFEIPVLALQGVNYAVDNGVNSYTLPSSIPGKVDCGIAPEDMLTAMLQYNATGAVQFPDIPCYVQLVVEGGIRDVNGNDVTDNFKITGKIALHHTSEEDLATTSPLWKDAPQIRSAKYEPQKEGGVVVDGFEDLKLKAYHALVQGFKSKKDASDPKDYGIHVQFNLGLEYNGTEKLDESAPLPVRIILFADLPLSVNVIEEIGVDFANILRAEEPFKSSANADIFQRDKPLATEQFARYVNAVQALGCKITLDDVFNTNNAFIKFGDSPTSTAPLFGPASEQSITKPIEIKIDPTKFLNTHPVKLDDVEMKFRIANGEKIYLKRGASFSAAIGAFLQTDGLVRIYPWKQEGA